MNTMIMKKIISQSVISQSPVGSWCVRDAIRYLHDPVGNMT